jgi:hypothetical protein
MSLDQATALYERFHAKAPDAVFALPASITPPARLGDAGRLHLVLYRSAKWSKDGSAHLYVHTYDTDVRFCEPWRPGMKQFPTEPWPLELVELGEFVDAAVARKGKWLHPVVPAGTRLCATPDGKRLALYHRHAGILAAIVGAQQRVTSRGIEG